MNPDLKRSAQTSEAENFYREAIEIGDELVSKAPSDYQSELVRSLCNYALLLSVPDDNDALERTKRKLKELHVTDLTSCEEWSEEEESNPQTD